MGFEPESPVKHGFSAYLGPHSPSVRIRPMLYTIFGTAKICAVEPRDYLHRVVIADSDNFYTVNLPRPIEEVLEVFHR